MIYGIPGMRKNDIFTVTNSISSWKNVFVWLPRKTLSGKWIYMTYAYRRIKQTQLHGNMPPKYPYGRFKYTKQYELHEIVIQRRLTGEN